LNLKAHCSKVLSLECEYVGVIKRVRN